MQRLANRVEGLRVPINGRFSPHPGKGMASCNANEEKAGHAPMAGHMTCPIRRTIARVADATHHNRRLHYSLIGTAALTGADALDSRVVPEPGTVGKAQARCSLPILANQDRKRSRTCSFQGLATRKPMLLFSLVKQSLIGRRPCSP